MESFIPKNILVTGGAGFIGSHVIFMLTERYRCPEYNITVVDKLDACASLENLQPLLYFKKIKFVRGDVGSADLIRHVLESNDIDTVMHFAAQTHVDNSFGNSIEFTVNNILGTHVLLEACRQWGRIRRFINVSTDEVYGESSISSDRALDENSTMYPTNPYAAAKAGAELMARSYHVSYGLPVIITRGNNVYGPKQFPEKLIPKSVGRIMRGETVPVHGDGTALRSFIHVDDVADAFDIILHKGVVGEVYNIGTPDERSVLSVVKDVVRIKGVDPVSSIEFVRDRAFNDRRYFIGSAKLHALGWKPKIEWETGLRETIEWYSKPLNMERWDSVELARAMKPHPDK